jgi:O-antigen/teichoic acid export membrane protein
VPVIQLLSLVGITGLFGDAVEPLLRGFGYPNRVLLIEAVQSALIIAVAWGLTGAYGLLGAPLAWWVAVAVSQVLSGLFLQKILKRPLTKLWVPATAIVTASGVGASVAFLFDQVFEGLAGLLLSLLAAAGAIAVVMRWCDHRYNLGLLGDLARLCPPFAPFIRTISASKGHPI